MSLVIGNVEKEYEKNNELKKADVEMIKQWLETQPHLPKVTEMQIIHFLHSNYYNSEAAKQCLDLFFTLRTQYHEFFSQRIPANVNFDVVLYTALPKPTPEGYRVLFAKLIDTNPDKFNFALSIKCLDMRSSIILNEEGTAPGYIVVQDLTGLMFGHVTKLNIFLLKKFFYYLQYSMPVRVKGLHFINTGVFMSNILALIKPFMKNELVSMVHTHPKMETVFKYIPKECFPSDYPGGTAPSFKELCKADKQNFIDHTDFFIAEEEQKVDESKRPNKPKESGKIFGITFKKLNID